MQYFYSCRSSLPQRENPRTWILAAGAPKLYTLYVLAQSVACGLALLLLEHSLLRCTA
jgi:hypothetical protein